LFAADENGDPKMAAGKIFCINVSLTSKEFFFLGLFLFVSNVNLFAVYENKRKKLKKMLNAL
jgi:hypothetical protein